MSGNAPVGRPPSYQYASTGNAPPGRSPPPPIDTRTGGHGYPPNSMYPPAAAPPGYGGGGGGGGYGYGAPAPSGGALYGRMNAAEVEGSQRNKAQLIVGIDFVRHMRYHDCECSKLTV